MMAGQKGNIMAYRNRWREFVELMEATALTVAGVAWLVFFAFL